MCLTLASSSACAVEVCSNANVVSGEYWLESASARKVHDTLLNVKFSYQKNQGSVPCNSLLVTLAGYRVKFV